MISSNIFMNQFIKRNRKRIGSACLLVMCILFVGVDNTLAQSADSSVAGSEKVPRFIHAEIIYADIDATNNRLVIVLSDGIWQYDLGSGQWQFLSDVKALPEDFFEFEFAYNNEKNVLRFWDRGVGRVFEVEPETFSVKRIDQSHTHKNQFKHQPFIKEGDIYAFGGYGYWIWKNYITYYNSKLQEWSVQNVNPESRVPSARVPYAGSYSSSLNKLFVYGGNIPSQEQRADDQYTAKKFSNDIWSFSFADNSWQKIAELGQSHRFYDPSSLVRIQRVNGISGSAYSNKSNIWYIPTINEDTSDELVFLTPVNTATGQVGKSFLLPSIESNQIVPTNFLFNRSSGDLIVVGIKKVTDRVEYPVEIIRISEDSLLSELQFPSSEEDGSWVYVLLFILLAGLTGAYYLKKRSQQKVNSPKEKELLSEEGIQQIQWLKSDEKLLLKYLFENQGFLESMKIDEAVWPDIDNYDYRRKLRNDTINSINKKFRNRLAVESDIITRMKDPDDKRRYLYGLDEDIADF